jgi:hypothetical protein
MNSVKIEVPEKDWELPVTALKGTTIKRSGKNIWKDCLKIMFQSCSININQRVQDIRGIQQ